MTAGNVYLALGGAHGEPWSHVKIGTALDPEVRIRELRQTTGLTLRPDCVDASSITLHHSFLGDRRTEYALHLAFDEYRDQGEWFLLADRMRLWVERLRPIPVAAARSWPAVIGWPIPWPIKL